MTNKEYIIDYLSKLTGNTSYGQKSNHALAAIFCDVFGRECCSETGNPCPYKYTGCISIDEKECNKMMNDDFNGKIPEETPVRKKGKWIKVGGFATPGGDPVWRCSVCGKGQHVYGIEASSYAKDVSDHQWLSCPNCDAEMSE